MKQTTKVTVIAELKILPGFESEVKAAAEMVWIETRKESGYETFLFNEKKDEATIVFFEVFKSQADFDFHVAATHTKTFLSGLASKVAGDGPVLTFLNQFED